jgi:transaldolase/glucose-6-phosphate isomerase
MANPLLGIRALGQSVWHDNIGRDLLRSGRLKGMIDEDGVSGLTSNPTIFEMAIGQERIYDHDIHVLVDKGLDVQAIYEGLVTADIREAADLLMPTYEETDGLDGYVSLEVSPHLAHDTSGTVSQAKRLFQTVDRKNLMIKVPATPEGLVAVRELVASGVNVNVTLLFSLEQYHNAAYAYVEGMEQWTASGGDPKQPASVASFFVSRVDTLIDERLKEIANPEWKAAASNLVGKAAIANARMAYALFKEIFHGERFAKLETLGVRPQRVLWASTSTKNPSYPDTYYVDALVGPTTVNTMPAVTLEAVRDHGQPASRLEEDVEEARQLFRELVRMGLRVEDLMGQLLENGLKSFADSFDKLLDGIERKRNRLLRGWGHRSASLGRIQEQVNTTLGLLDEEEIIQGLWAGDVSIWSDDAEAQSEIGKRLGWLHAVETMADETRRINEFVDGIRSSGLKKAVLLGMGGSSLAAEVFASCFGTTDGYLDLRVLDTTIPGAILDLERSIDFHETLFIVSSKSGSTIEVLSLYKYFYDKMVSVCGDEAGRHFVAITDPGTGLGKLASQNGFRRVFLNPSDIGGRFSALSYFGLVPAALIGIDLDRLLMRASQAVEASGPEVPSLESPGAWLGVIMAEAALDGKDKLSLIISPAMVGFGSWLEQLLAESTGKDGTGILPVENEPVGPPEVYGRDRLFVYLRLDEESAYDQHVSALEQAGHPVVTLRLHSPYDLGREIFRWEFATAVAGTILGINSFDQPNVQESKDITRQLLEFHQNNGQLPDDDSVPIDDPALTEMLRKFINSTSLGSYVALTAFLRNSTRNWEILQTIRELIRNEFKLATTVGFGPRYLHSTGQIHKGGADTGHFVLITSDNSEDAEIPGEPYSFGVLNEAQSLGDSQALINRGRHLIHVRLGSENDLEKLLEAVRAI